MCTLSSLFRLVKILIFGANIFLLRESKWTEKKPVFKCWNLSHDLNAKKAIHWAGNVQKTENFHLSLNTAGKRVRHLWWHKFHYHFRGLTHALRSFQWNKREISAHVGFANKSLNFFFRRFQFRLASKDQEREKLLIWSIENWNIFSGSAIRSWQTKRNKIELNSHATLKQYLRYGDCGFLLPIFLDHSSYFIRTHCGLGLKAIFMVLSRASALLVFLFSTLNLHFSSEIRRLCKVLHNS